LLSFFFFFTAASTTDIYTLSLHDALPIFAAIFVDGGFAAASSFVRRFWEPLIDEMEEPPRDPKTALQEWAQARGLALPAYELVRSEEHTSELQSRSDLVCRLLLEKKKIKP